MPVSRLLMPGCFGMGVDDAGQDIPPHPLEAGYVASAAPKRRRDFALGRFCAHEALVQMGRDEPAIPIGASGAPVWPAGIVGSITHTQGYAAAVVAARNRFQAIGIDAERIGGVTEALMPRLFGPAEQQWLMMLEAERRITALTVLFSAKEAFYKAFSGQTSDRLSFKNIHIEMQGDGFIACHANRVAQGRVAIEGDLVVTAVIAP